jgi:hypothetical protein
MYRQHSVDMIKCIIGMCLFALSTIQESWFVVPPTIPTPWIKANLELRMAGDKPAADLLIGWL